LLNSIVETALFEVIPAAVVNGVAPFAGLP